MRYLGSKSYTVDKIYSIVHNRIETGSFCDPFGGLGIVGSYFKKHGYSVWTSDILVFAHYFQIARIELGSYPEFSLLKKHLCVKSILDTVDVLNSLKPNIGWFVKEYADERQFFTIENACRINACWKTINKWRSNGLLGKPGLRDRRFRCRPNRPPGH